MRTANATDLPFESKFDWCVSSLVLHRVPRKVRTEAIEEMFRVLKPGGTVVGNFHAHLSLMNSYRICNSGIN